MERDYNQRWEFLIFILNRFRIQYLIFKIRIFRDSNKCETCLKLLISCIIPVSSATKQTYHLSDDTRIPWRYKSKLQHLLMSDLPTPRHKEQLVTNDEDNTISSLRSPLSAPVYHQVAVLFLDLVETIFRISIRQHLRLPSIIIF